MATALNITNGFYQSRHLPLSHQQCKNCFVSIADADALSEEQLVFTPGVEQLATTGTVKQANRGAHVKNGIPYFVNGNGLYRLNKNTDSLTGVVSYDTTLLGTLNSDSGSVSMADNGFQLMILEPGGLGYIYNEDAGTPFSVITDSDFYASGLPQYVIFIDGYFACSTDSKAWIVSGLNDGTSWNALDFGSAESDPDDIVALIVILNQLYVIGSETTEGFENDPSLGLFPFVRNNVFLDKGCVAPLSLVKSNSTFFMIGAGEHERVAVWQFVDSAYTKVSHKGIDKLLSTLTGDELSEISAFTYGDGGYFFVCFKLPTTTICYEIVSGKWHERTSVIDEEETCWRVSSLVSAYGKLLVGDTVDGQIGELSFDFVTEYSVAIVRLFSTQPFVNNGEPIPLSMLELTMESGAGNSDAPDPVVSMAVSKDGKTWTQERVRKIGKVGQYNRRIVWYRNGIFERFAVLRFRMSDPIKSAFIKLEYE